MSIFTLLGYKYNAIVYLRSKAVLKLQRRCQLHISRLHNNNNRTVARTVTNCVSSICSATVSGTEIDIVVIFNRVFIHFNPLIIKLVLFLYVIYSVFD